MNFHQNLPIFKRSLPKEANAKIGYLDYYEQY